MHNTWVIYLLAWDNSPKGLLIPDKTTALRGWWEKVLARVPPIDEPAAYQLVGGVTAHQGYDG